MTASIDKYEYQNRLSNSKTADSLRDLGKIGPQTKTGF